LPLEFHEKKFTYGGQEYVDTSYGSFGQFGDYPSHSPSWFTMEARAVNGALEKLKAQKVNLGVMFGERKATARMFSDLVTRIADEIVDFKRIRKGDWLKVKKLDASRRRTSLRDIPASWLALQYGWKPAMSDFYGSLEALADRELNEHPRITVTKMVGEKLIRKFTQPGSFNTSGYDLEWKEAIDTGVSVSLTYDMDNSFVRALSQTGITNPAEIIWELVPYSFVVDWALPIGEWLGLLSATTGWAFRGGSLSKMDKRYAVVHGMKKARNGNDPGWETIRVSGLDRLRRQSWGFDRTVYSSSPLPRIYFQNPLSLGHVANGLSLLATAMR
jgi:hypothetical protein